MQFTAPDVTDRHRTVSTFRWFDMWADDQLIAACAAGLDDGHVSALAVAQAHYALATLALHEVGEWYTYRGEQVFPPHRPDPCLPGVEDRGPDGNGQVILWLDYGRAALPAAAQHPGRWVARSAVCPVDRADLGTLPGQILTLTSVGVCVTPPHGGAATVTAWTVHPAADTVLEQALRDVHHGMAMSELTVIAAHLRLAGMPVLAPVPATGAGGVACTAHLSYDG
ncbi:hypothetical protein V1J52_24410 [Streptomyces sp. TRM 70351]|uniref:hypothetical protein n=1 Tax=Streptomyces sp. TRM 70351 TaxID=3116552 RepID=UPI002E7B886B|nr:hypothetical protein [Streptomyces sp. TRM 70351]MEE1931279.1 hypothetical protein [Streptomyces sp. TRM 70351]